MRYEVARKICEAFNNVEDGLTVEVSFDSTSDRLRLVARKVWYAATYVPLKGLANDDIAVEKLAAEAEKLVKAVVESAAKGSKDE